MYNGLAVEKTTMEGVKGPSPTATFFCTALMIFAPEVNRDS